MERDQKRDNGPFRPGTKEYFAEISQVVNALSLAGMDVLRDTRQAKKLLMEQQRQRFKNFNDFDKPLRKKERKDCVWQLTQELMSQTPDYNIYDQQAGDSAASYNIPDVAYISEEDTAGIIGGPDDIYNYKLQMSMRRYESCQESFRHLGHPVHFTRSTSVLDELDSRDGENGRWSRGKQKPRTGRRPRTRRVSRRRSRHQHAQTSRSASIVDEWDFRSSDGVTTRQAQREHFQRWQRRAAATTVDPFTDPQPSTSAQATLAGSLPWSSVYPAVEDECAPYDPDLSTDVDSSATGEDSPPETFMLADDDMSAYEAANKVTVEDLQLALNTVFKQLSNADEESISQCGGDEASGGMALAGSTTPHHIKSFGRRKSSMSENEIDRRSPPPFSLYELFPSCAKDMEDYPDYWRSRGGPSSPSETVQRPKCYTPEELYRFQDTGEYLPAGEYAVPMRDETKHFSPTGSVWSMDGASSAQLEDEMSLSLSSDVDSNIMMDDDITH